jgi:hypothetical protein
MSNSPTPPASTSLPSATVKRLLHELRDYASSPNEALLHLGPVRDDELMHWEAVLKGPEGSGYEGIFNSPDIRLLLSQQDAVLYTGAVRGIPNESLLTNSLPTQEGSGS